MPGPHPLILSKIVVVVVMSIMPFICLSQERDSAKKISLARKTFILGMDAITTSNNDTVVNESSTSTNVQYQGKIIRHINLEAIQLERSIYDSTKRTKKIITDIADALHGTTRESVIRNHIFIGRHKPLNPYLLADNERYIRDLDFILDCRIVVTPVPGSEDSVDITVITRDVFSLGFRIGGSFPTAPKFGLYDANLFGRGQRVDVTMLVDQDRTPKAGYSLYYRKSSVLGSLASFEVGYSELNTNRSYGEENEFAYYIRVNRPLVSPYSRMAGGFEVSRNWSENVYNAPDSLFLKYRYKILDGWLGYNIGINKPPDNRYRHFVSMRYFDGQYLNQPEQEEYKEDRTYNNQKGVLGQYSFYWQNLYRTRYVFGFGRTEDVPYGMAWSITSGLFNQLGLKRTYLATAFQRSFANRKGNFYTFVAQGGSYFRNQKAEDAVLSTSITYFSRAFSLNRYKLRGYLRGAYAQLFNQQINDPVEINDSEVNGFSADSVWGDKKAALRMQTVLYTPWQLFGFRFAIFGGVDHGWLKCTVCEKSIVNITGIYIGFRTRNENLIFGTMEVRGTYVPATGVSPAQFNFEFKQRLKVKNSGTFVKPPTTVSY